MNNFFWECQWHIYIFIYIFIYININEKQPKSQIVEYVYVFPATKTKVFPRFFPCWKTRKSSTFRKPAAGRLDLIHLYKIIGYVWLPSRKLTYPTLGSWENHRLKSAIFEGYVDMLVPWRVCSLKTFPLNAWETPPSLVFGNSLASRSNRFSDDPELDLTMTWAF